MPRVTRIAAFALVVTATMWFTAVAHGFTLSGYKWYVSTVLIFVNPTNLDVSASAAETAVKAGMSAWNGKASFKFAYGGRVLDKATAIDGRNVVIFRNATNSTAVATTYSWSRNGARFDSDTVFWDAKYRFYAGTSGCSYGAFIEDITAHELGHTVGFLHSSITDATMYPTYRYCGTIMRTLASDDLAGLRKLYP